MTANASSHVQLAAPSLICHITSLHRPVKLGVGCKTKSLEEPVAHTGGTTNYVVPQKIHTQGVQCYKEGHSGVTFIESHRLAFRATIFDIQGYWHEC